MAWKQKIGTKSMRTKARKNTHINEHSSQHQDHTIQYKLCDLPYVMAYFETKLSNPHVGNEPIVVSNYT